MGIKETLSGFRDHDLVSSLVERLAGKIREPLRVMEVCGTHTMAISKHGIRSLLPTEVELVSGPGCPVCVTSAGQIDAFIEIAKKPQVRVMTFGDLFRVPGSNSSLALAAAQGANVEIVYSALDALEKAKKNPDELVVFLGVGFETTTPTIAATIIAAKQQKVDNFAVFSAHKIMPPALEALLDDPKLKIDALLCPGHVSAIIGTVAYEDMARRHGLACVVAGFEPTDIIQALVMIADQARDGRHEAENAYLRAVSHAGNKRAMMMIEEVFEPVDTNWRGLGLISASGLAIRPQYEEFDVQKRMSLEVINVPEPKGCRCGEILKGIKSPSDCPLFGKACTPSDPVGPCMVSSEGTCGVHYRYGSVKL